MGKKYFCRPQKIWVSYFDGTNKSENYCMGEWVEGSGTGIDLYSAVDRYVVAQANTRGIDFATVLNYGRKVGGPPLRKMTFHERARCLKALALYLLERKENFYRISYYTGQLEKIVGSISREGLETSLL